MHHGTTVDSPCGNKRNNNLEDISMANDKKIEGENRQDMGRNRERTEGVQSDNSGRMGSERERSERSRNESFGNRGQSSNRS